MKIIFNQNRIIEHSLKLAVCGLWISFLTVQSCTKSDPKSETERVKEILTANTWVIQSVTVDGIDKTSDYSGMTLAFTNTNYSTENGGLVWPDIGAWKFADDSGKIISRNDDLIITIEEASTTKLVMKLMWLKTTLSGGRSESVRGAHVFVFRK